MGALDQITQMKNQGIPENEIINKLREQNVSPKAINDALEQSKVKEAVSKPFIEEGMEPSVVGGGAMPAGNSARAQEEGIPNDEFYIPQSRPRYSRNYPSTQEYNEGDQTYEQSYDQNYGGGYDSGYGQDSYSGGYDQGGYSEEYYPQEGYGQDSYSGSSGTDTMIEIAEQVFAEKIRKIQKHVEELNEFKVLAETKLNSAVNRLKRIEETIDKLQMAILEKIGSYGRGLDNIKKEMSMMQDSFSKTLPSLAHHHSAHHITHKKTTKKKTVSRKKK